jgi:cell wall-active antibiotic response 4TMS protein YvqF
MAVYTRNRNCPCARCRAHGMMGAGILVTLGVLFLLDTNGIIWFGQSWPVLLLVIGAFIFLTHSASTENHIDPYAARAAMNAPPATWTRNPPPPPAAWTDNPPAPPAATPEQNSQVKP